jgi:hypothetical protein
VRREGGDLCRQPAFDGVPALRMSCTRRRTPCARPQRDGEYARTLSGQAWTSTATDLGAPLHATQSNTEQAQATQGDGGRHGLLRMRCQHKCTAAGFWSDRVKCGELPPLKHFEQAERTEQHEMGVVDHTKPTALTLKPMGSAASTVKRILYSFSATQSGASRTSAPLRWARSHRA